MGSDGERDAARVKVEHDEPETLRPDAQDVAVAVDEDGIPLVENPSEDIIVRSDTVNCSASLSSLLRST